MRGNFREKYFYNIPIKDNINVEYKNHDLMNMKYMIMSFNPPTPTSAQHFPNQSICFLFYKEERSRRQENKTGKVAGILVNPAYETIVSMMSLETHDQSSLHCLQQGRLTVKTNVMFSLVTGD